jgi:hypothetical protein
MVSSTRSALRAIPRHLSRRSTALSALARPVASIPATCTSSASNAPFGSPCASALSQKRWGGSKYIGRSAVVVKPKTTEEVSKVMKYCYENDIAVVPQGGNTGLVGASLYFYAIALPLNVDCAYRACHDIRNSRV